jgi:hypothetical protein
MKYLHSFLHGSPPKKGNIYRKPPTKPTKPAERTAETGSVGSVGRFGYISENLDASGPVPPTADSGPLEPGPAREQPALSSTSDPWDRLRGPRRTRWGTLVWSDPSQPPIEVFGAVPSHVEESSVPPTR